ncbi:MAG: OmpH family outer membrane protein [Rhizomicrobium sp.]
MKLSRLARAAAAALLFAGLAPAALAAPPGPPQPPLPQPKILIIDRAEVLRRSSAGTSIMTQVQQLARNAENNLKGRGAALQKEGEALRQQIAILSPAVKAAKVKAFETKQAALQQDVQKQQALIQGGLYVARETVLKALGPILQKIVIERGANLLLDRSLIIVSSNAFDVTAVAVQRLNQVLPNVVVKPTMPPNQGPPQQ